MAAVFTIVERQSGKAWALASLAAGVGGSFAMSEPAGRQRAPEPVEGVLAVVEQPEPAETRVSELPV